MAKGKKSFVLYTDQIGIFSKLTDEQAGLLIKHIYAYCNDEEPKGDFVTELAFESIKQALKRDLRKFEDVKVKRSEAGKKSAEARKKQKATKSTSVKSVQQKATKSTVSVSDNVNVSVSDNKNTYKEKKEKFLNWFNLKKEKHTGKIGRFKILTSTDDKNLKKLYKDYGAEEFEIAIKNLYKSKWAIENNMLTPSHYLRVENFNKYLNQGDTVKRLNTFD